MAWIQDKDMKTHFLAVLSTKLIQTCNGALTVSHEILEALPEEPPSSVLSTYLKDLLPHLETVREFPHYPPIEENAATACEIIRAALNFCLISSMEKPLAELKTLKSRLNDAFILTSCLTRSPLAVGDELIEEWSKYFQDNFKGDLDFTSSLLPANSKFFKRAIYLNGPRKRKRSRPAKSKKKDRRA